MSIPQTPKNELITSTSTKSQHAELQASTLKMYTDLPLIFTD